MLYYLVLIDNLITWWTHDSGLIMDLMLSPRHNGIHDCISNNAIYILILIHQLFHLCYIIMPE